MVIGFDAFHAAPARVVEVDADEDGVFLFVAERDPVVEGDESVVGPSENGLELGLAQFAVDPQSDIERDYFFRRAIAPVGAAIFASVASIHDDGLEGVTGVGRDGRAAAQKNSARGQGSEAMELNRARHEK